uniref:Protein zwilch n=1 Tax=Strigamia maritima TaxID=126957 RepID=T1IZH8_STRMM
MALTNFRTHYSGNLDMAFDGLETVINRLSTLPAGIKTIPEIYEDFCLLVEEDISFLDTLFHIPSRIILVQSRQVDFSSEALGEDEDGVDKYRSNERLDLTGSPLKDNYKDDDFEITEVVSKSTAGYKPVSLKNARCLLSWYNRYCGSESILPIGIVCDGVRENIIYFGCTFGNRELNWKIVTINPSNEKSKNSLENLKSKHSTGLKNKKIDEIEVTSSYELTGSPLECELDKKTNLILVNLKWNNCETIFELPPSNALCSLMMKVNPNRPDSILHSNYEELKILEMLLGSIESQVHDDATEDSVIINVKNKLLSLFQELKRTSIIGLRKKATSQDRETVLPFSTRQRELDITDQLWTILKDFYHMPQLILQCMEIVKNQWKLIQHVLFKDNTTKLVKLFSGATPTCVLTEKLCLEFLFDIGIKKVQRDYINFIIGSELATKDLMDNFLHPTNSVEYDVINELKQLHYAVDLISVCAITFTLSAQRLRLLTRHILTEMQTKSQDDVIEYQISTHLVLPLIRSENFDKWQVRLSSDENSYKKVTTYQISRSWPNWIESSEGYCHVVCEEMWARNIV